MALAFMTLACVAPRNGNDRRAADVAAEATMDVADVAAEATMDVADVVTNDLAGEGVDSPTTDGAVDQLDAATDAALDEDTADAPTADHDLDVTPADAPPDGAEAGADAALDAPDGPGEPDATPGDGPGDGAADISDAAVERCPGELLRCGGACVDVRFDPAHCGGCASPCRPSQSCVLGVCRDEALDLAAWSTHACVVQATGEVACWGDNTGSVLGAMGPAPTAPAVVTALTAAARVAVGNSYTCAVHPDNTADCVGTIPGMPTWTRVPLPNAGVGVRRVAIGDDFACALQTDGWVSCWGSSDVGQRGVGRGGSPPMPERIMGSGPPFQQLIAGAQHACALRNDGRVACWGYNTNAQASALEGPIAYPNFVTAVGGGGHLMDVIALGRGSRHTCAIRSDRSVVCWGLNTSGELGDGTTTARRDPVRALWPGMAEEVCGGDGYTCVRATDGTVHCWGANRNNVLGGTPPAPLEPTRVAGLADVARITCARDYVCARRRNGSVVCWGNGPLGEGARESRLASDREIPGIPASERCAGADCAALAVAGHAFTGCAVRPSGRVMCWGNNDSGQLGDGTTVTRSGPTHVRGLSDATSVSVSTAGTHACAVSRAGEVWCWGLNTSGQLGDGTVSTSRGLPGVVPGLSDVVQVSAGDTHSCAVQRSRRVLCWGANDQGQLGDDSRTRRLTPTLVGPAGSPLLGVTQVAAGRSVTCALRAEGRISCWGSRAFWQIGDGVTTSAPQQTPVEVRNHDGADGGSSVLTGATEVGVSAVHACAALPDRVACWGSNPQGELGVPARTLAASSTPRTVPADELGGARALLVTTIATNVVRSGGTLHSWTHDPSGNPFHYEHPFRDAVRDVGGGVLGNVWAVVRTTNGTMRAWGNGSALSTGGRDVRPSVPVPFFASP